MDTPFYERLPGEVTILHAIQVPDLPDQKLKFPDGAEKTIGAGATACKQAHGMALSKKDVNLTSVLLIVFSGARAFEMLNEDEKEFAMNTTVTYAPQAYEYIRHCKASADGLTIPTFGREVSIDELSAWTWDKVAEHPVSLFLILVE